ncbi:MAG: DUF2953 domain-containing protein [Lachnospiraceae bacterium]|nr:DUF2953 domain-containing protein [Lachnospiraceae bacterium]
MLHVILQILAVIGVIILCILGISLLLILLVLFVPIRYRANGKREGEVMEFAAKATYLLHMLTVKFVYPEPGSVIVRLFGIKIFDSAKSKDKEGGDVSPNTDKVKDKQAEGATETEGTIETEATAETEGNTETEATVETEGNTKTERIAETSKTTNTGVQSGEKAEVVVNTESTEGQNSQNDENSQKEKKSLIDKIQYTFNTICDKIRNIIAKIKGIFSNISYYKEVLTKTENKKLYGRLKDRLLKVLKSIRPRVIKADVRIGTGSPDTTAYIYGIYGMLMPVLGKNVKNINIDLDFENTVYEGEVFLKGRITLFTILVQAVKVLLDKQLHVFLKQLKREE